MLPSLRPRLARAGRGKAASPLSSSAAPGRVGCPGATRGCVVLALVLPASIGHGPRPVAGRLLGERSLGTPWSPGFHNPAVLSELPPDTALALRKIRERECKPPASIAPRAPPTHVHGSSRPNEPPRGRASRSWASGCPSQRAFLAFFAMAVSSLWQRYSSLFRGMPDRVISLLEFCPPVFGGIFLTFQRAPRAFIW